MVREDRQGHGPDLLQNPLQKEGGVKLLRETSRTWKLKPNFLQLLLVQSRRALPLQMVVSAPDE